MPIYAQDSSLSGSIRGRVQNQKGDPLPKVKVRAISRRTDKMAGETESDDKGTFTLRLPEGRYTLDLYSAEHQRETIPVVEVEAGKETKMDRAVRLREVNLYAALRGAVVNSDGFLVRGARVRIERIPFQTEPIDSFTKEQPTNESGEFGFRLPAIPSRYRVTATAKGFKPGSDTVDIGGAERHNMVIRLEREP
jgi:hypothetical protein